MVSSRVYPSLERKPGGPDNWVEAAKGLPSYIERIAKHLHYERGYTISHAIATAVNTVKRWAKGGTVTKYGTTKTVSPATVAKAAAAVASWVAKRKIGALALTEAEFLVIDLTDVGDDLAFDLLDLADADVEDTDTMVALMLPPETASKIAVEGGVPAADMHITLTFHKEVDDAQFQELTESVKNFASHWSEPITATIGGLDHFPAKDPEKGDPYFAEVTSPSIMKLQKRLAALLHYESDYDKYKPHVTLTYVKDGETPPSPPENFDIEFSGMTVVRGNTQRVDAPFKAGASTDLTSRAILSAGDIDLSKDGMDLQVLADRANKIKDPTQRAAARQAVLDLAVPKSELTAEKRRRRAAAGSALPDGSFPVFDRTSLKSALRLARIPEQRRHVIRRAKSLGLESMIPKTWSISLAEVVVEDLIIDLASTIAPRNARGKATDGRNSFRGQGKWKHGFVPANRAAKEAKAKGSPIAMKRMNRLFGKDKAADDVRKPTREVAAKGRVGQRTAGGVRKNNPTKIKVDEKAHPGSESAKDIAHLRSTPFSGNDNKNVTDAGKGGLLPDEQKEASKSSRVPERARQNWDEIPEALKTVRNGTRYVLAEFGGKQYVTEWLGGVVKGETKNTSIRSTLSIEAAKGLSTSELRAAMKDPRASAQSRKVARLALRDPSRKASA